MNTKLHVVLADIHYPYHCSKSIKAIFQFIKAHRNQIESLVLLGDELDCENVSRHTQGKPGLRKRGGYKQDIDGFKRTILDPLDAMLKRTCKKTIFEGNHEDWIQDLLDEQPELVGLLELPELLDLKARGWKWIPCGGHINIGKVALMHGDQIGSGTHVAKKLVEQCQGTAIMGHVHRASMFTTTSIVTKKKKHAGYTLPCLCTVAPKYAKGQPNAFSVGFGLLEQGSTDNINVNVIIIMPDGTFNYGGKEYGRA